MLPLSFGDWTQGRLQLNFPAPFTPILPLLCREAVSPNKVWVPDQLSSSAMSPQCWPWLGTLSSQVSPLEQTILTQLHPPAAKNHEPCALLTDLPGFTAPATAFLFCCVLSFDIRGQKSLSGCLLLEICHPLWSSMAVEQPLLAGPALFFHLVQVLFPLPYC